MDETTGGRRRGEADDEETGTEYGHSATSRRQFLRAAGASAVATGAGSGLGTAQTVTPGEQAPFDGPHVAPCLIPAVHFDRGGEGVAYHEASPDEGPGGGDYRDEAVDLQRSPEGGYNVGWIEAGEWWEYTVEVPETDSYRLSLRIAATATDPGLTIVVDGQESTDYFLDDVSAAGAWQSWRTVEYGGFDEFEAGEHAIRVRADTGGWNFKWLEVGIPDADVPGVDTWGEGIATVARSDTSVTFGWDDDGFSSRALQFSRDGTTVEVSGPPPLTIDGLEPDTAYTFDDRRSNFERTVRTAPAEADDRAPLAPPDFTAEVEQTPRIDVSWNPARDLGGAGVHHYAVYLDGERVRTRPATATSASFTDRLERGQTYDVGLAAVDAFGNESERRTETVSTGESAPTGVPSPAENLRVSNRGPTELTFRWDDFAADDLDRVELRWEDARSGEALPPADERVSGSESVEPHEDVKLLRGLDSGVPYEFEVRAVDVDGHASEWASIVARTPPAPTNLRVSGMDLPSLTLAWDRPYDDWDGFDLTEYEVTVEGGPTRTVDASVGSVTVEAFPAEGFPEVTVTGIDAAGERTTSETIAPTVDAGDGSGSDRVVDGPRTHLGSGVGDYVAGWLGEVRSGPDFDRASITVAGGTVWIRGRIHVGYHDSRPVFVTDATFEGDRLHVTIGYEGGHEPAVGTIAYQAGLGVDRRPSEVVVHHPTPYAASWTEDGPGGTVVPVVTRPNPEADQTVEGALLLPNWTDGVTSGRVEVSVPDSFASLEVEPFRADVDATVEVDGDTLTATFDAPAGEDALAGSDDVLGPTEFRYETGTVLARFSVSGSEPGVATVDVTDASLTAPTGEDVAQGAASTEFRIDPRFEVADDYPYDLDRDGLYEDLNANGERDLADAVTLYQERDAAAVEDHSRYVDFSGNGEVDLADVVQLFQENAG